MKLFGSGTLWGSPIQDANGNALSSAAPIQFAVLQEAAIDISFDTKLLYGQFQFPVDAGRGKGKIDCKAKSAEVNGALYNSIFFGQTTTFGIVNDYLDSTGTVIPGTPFTITPSIPSSGTWSVDLGVRSAAGVPLVKVPSAPTTGQYSVSGGVYTFSAADVTKVVYISFQYTATSTTAPKSTIANLLMGSAPTFRADISVQRGTKSMNWIFYACISNKLAITTKQDDFIIPEFDFSIIADGNGNVASWSFSE